MSRAARFSYRHAMHHVTLRCNNREFLFSTPTFNLFLDVLQEARRSFPISLYNYCLMTNHLHLLFKVGHADTLSKVMHWISSTFSKRFNRMAGRRGHLWEGRFRSTIIEESSFFFRCMAYIDLNPVRARMVATPLDYRWCGHRALRNGDESVLDFHRLHLEGGRDAASRYRSYAKLLAEEAERPAVPLATAHFVGTSRFIGRLTKRFGLRGEGSRLQEESLEGDRSETVLCIRPHRGTLSILNDSGTHKPLRVHQ
jgi:REP-associated tyrosine transposase